MRRKFIAAAASGVLALTMTAALPTIHAAAVSIWNDITPGTESVETFQYKDYADRYSDAYELYGYDAEALFNHYETVGKAEGRVGRFKKTAEEDDRHPYVWDADEPLDPLPPLEFSAQPDWFETVCLLSKLNVKHHIEVEITMDELDLTAAESKATYDEIKAYVLEKFGFKVSQLYIAQIKRKCGIIERKNYNQSKKEDAKVPKCPPEKEAAIMDALKHFQMIP